MAKFDSTNQAKAALKKTTWGTEGDITSGGIYLFASNITCSGGYETVYSRDFGTSGKRTIQRRTRAAFNVSITCESTFGQGWLALLSGLMGTESVPAETTGGQSDYSRNIDLADYPSVCWTLVYSVETDKTRCIPSLKITSASFAGDAAGVGTWTFQGIGHSFIESSSNTVSEIAALSTYTYDQAILGGGNHYFRYGAYSTVTALTSTNNLPILNISLSLERPLQGQHVLQGANSFFVTEPLQQGDTMGSISFRLPTLESSVADLMSDWYTAPYKMAELFYDGTQIGTGVNHSIKIQLPYLQSPGELAGGQDLPSNNQFFQPAINLTMLKASSAPSGMSGVTDYLRVVSIDKRSSKWTA